MSHGGWGQRGNGDHSSVFCYSAGDETSGLLSYQECLSCEKFKVT